MSLAEDDEAPAAASALPSRAAEARDALGNFCFYLHLGVMVYFLAGWAVPVRGVLIFYLFFIPMVAVQWRFNKNSCVLNNIESFIRTRQWRDPHNKEEGAWLMTLVHSATGITLTSFQVDLLTHAILAVLWCAGLSHLLWW